MPSYYIMPGAKPENTMLPGMPRQNQPTAPAAGPVLGQQAVRPTGPSSGFDSQYLQNLATAIGGLFSNPQGGQATNFNPLGNLQEISPSSGIGGTAPTLGEPLTWLQKALTGGSFSYAPQTQAISGTPATVKATPNKYYGYRNGT